MTNSRAIFEKNANACESAKYPACKCACGGELHGSAHSIEWRRATWEAIEARREQERRERAERDTTLDLFAERHE